jgi:glycosyltransferase involved in cell wall biosynthesis
MVKAMSKLASVVVYYYSQGASSETTRDNLTLRGFQVPAGVRSKNVFYCPARLRTILANNSDNLDAVILYGSFITANVPVVTLLRKAKLPYIFFPHEGFSSYTFVGKKALTKGTYEASFERPIVEAAMGVRLLSHIQLEEFKQRGYDIQRKSFFLSEGIDWEKIKAELNDPVPYYLEPGPTDELVFGYLGRFVMYKKGLDILLKAWGLYKAKGGKGILKLVGPGSATELRDLENLCRDLRLSHVHILPPLQGDAKYRYLSEISALVHPSRHEGIPRVLRESMAFGCPIITTVHTNATELLSKAGLIAKLEPQSLADKLHAFAKLSHQERITMKREVLKTANLLNWTPLTKTFVEEIQALLGRSTESSKVWQVS